MSYNKTNLDGSILPLRDWCACENCGYRTDDPPSSEYNVRSGAKNPKQNS